MDYSSCDTVQLQAMLASLHHELADIEETMNFNFTYTSAHIGGREVRKDEESLMQLKEKIVGIETMLRVRSCCDCHDK